MPRSLTGLTFGTTAVGLRCYELADVVLAAQDAMLLEVDGSSYTHATVRLGRNEARKIAVSSGITTVEAERLGGMLVEDVFG